MMTEDEVRAEFQRASEAYGSQKAFAEWIGVSPQYAADFLNRRRGPGPAILKAMGLRKVVGYERAAE